MAKRNARHSQTRRRATSPKHTKMGRVPRLFLVRIHEFQTLNRMGRSFDSSGKTAPVTLLSPLLYKTRRKDQKQLRQTETHRKQKILPESVLHKKPQVEKRLRNGNDGRHLERRSQNKTQKRQRQTPLPASAQTNQQNNRTVH